MKHKKSIKNLKIKLKMKLGIMFFYKNIEKEGMLILDKRSQEYYIKGRNVICLFQK